MKSKVRSLSQIKSSLFFYYVDSVTRISALKTRGGPLIRTKINCWPKNYVLTRTNTDTKANPCMIYIFTCWHGFLTQVFCVCVIYINMYAFLCLTTTHNVKLTIQYTIHELTPTISTTPPLS